MIEDTLGLCGTVVADKYEVREAVGKGGFSIVYRAQHTLWKRPVALKVFKALDGASEADRRAMTEDLVREASVLAELSEKTASICQARDLGTLTTPAGEALPYMVLEWLEGRTLADTLAAEHQARLPPRSMPAAVALLDPIAEALAVAHSHGIAHRDVKPANVFLSTDAEGRTLSVKLLDFGIAKVVEDAQRTGRAFHKTAGHVTAFTPTYGAPEQFSRKFGATGPWTDVFSLALVLIECVTGRRLASTNDFVQLAAAATDPARRPTPRMFGLMVSDATEAVFARALAVHLEGRFSTAGAFWVALLTSLSVEPSRAMLAAVEAPEQDLFAGIGNANTAPAPASPSEEPAKSVGAAGPPVPPRTRARSGRAVLAVGSLLGVAFVGLLYAGLHYDRATSPSRAAIPLVPVPAAASSTPTVPAARGCPEGMVLIGGGEFFMGADEGTELEKPAHHVELSSYCIDVYEVTTSRYSACSDGGKCKRASRVNDWPGIGAHDREAFDPLCSIRDLPAQAEHPIVCVDWFMAETFCQSLPGGRLPTEAEWEFAARGPDGRRYPWGDDKPGPHYLNACGSECVSYGKELKVPMTAMYPGDDSWPSTAQVGSFPKGKFRFGLFDVSGNVAEWVADWEAPYTKEAARDPKGPAAGKTRVIRGGAWNAGVDTWVTPTFRFMSGPEVKSYGTGFRCAAEPR